MIGVAARACTHAGLECIWAGVPSVLAACFTQEKPQAVFADAIVYQLGSRVVVVQTISLIIRPALEKQVHVITENFLHLLGIAMVIGMTTGYVGEKAGKAVDPAYNYRAVNRIIAGSTGIYSLARFVYALVVENALVIQKQH